MSLREQLIVTDQESPQEEIISDSSILRSPTVRSRDEVIPASFLDTMTGWG